VLTAQATEASTAMLENEAEVEANTEALAAALETMESAEDAAFLANRILDIKQEDVDQFSDAYYAA